METIVHARAAAPDACADCHTANAHENMMFSGFYEPLKPLPVGAG